MLVMIVRKKVVDARFGIFHTRICAAFVQNSPTGKHATGTAVCQSATVTASGLQFLHVFSNYLGLN